jgi:pimeloyl-ACP methyl ester carboxylesterase
MSWKRVWLGALIVALGIPCGAAQAKKKKAPPAPRVDEVVFTGLEGFELPGKVTVPAKVRDDEVTRVVVLLHGSGPQDMDEDLAQMSEGWERIPFFEQLSGALVDAGFATVRFHKRSYVIRKTLEKDLLYVEDPEFLAFNEDALRYLVEDAAAVAAQARERFPAAKIYLLGHSQGTYIGLQLAGEHDWIAGVGMIGFYGSRLETLAFEQVVYRSNGLFQSMDGDGDGVATREEMVGHPLGVQLAAELEPIDTDGDGALTRAEFMGANYSNLLVQELIPASYSRRETEYPTPASLIKELAIPLVFFSGMLDNQTPAYQTMGVEAINGISWKKDNLTFRYYDGLGHALDPRDAYDDLVFRPAAAGTLTDVAATLDQAFVLPAE